MRERYDPKTSDLTVFLSWEEAQRLRPSSSYSPALYIKTQDGRVFHFLFIGRKSQPFITVNEPRDPFLPHYWIIIGIEGYEELLRRNQIGTRYFLSSKINLSIDEELSQPNP